MGELEDLLGPFEQQKIIVNDRLVKQKSIIGISRSASTNQIDKESPEKTELQ